jgi:hypothetical protein
MLSYVIYSVCSIGILTECNENIGSYIPPATQ